ncbi:MAG: cytochrome c biogenesis protein [Planctomycetota bacterium]|jgi:ABC-type transport system involved in cytochrome c biogenesis permease subunit
MRLTLKGAFAGLVMATLALSAAPVTAQEAPPPPGASTAPEAPTWDKETLKLAALIPVQDGGRVKPLSTLAGFKLLRMNGRRKVELDDGRKIKATEWILDCLFFPDWAARQRFFLVENDEVLDAVGVKHEGRKKRDRYSYSDIRDARMEIMRKAREYSEMDAKDRTPVQAQMLRLAESMIDYEHLSAFLDFTRTELPTDLPALSGVFETEKRPGLSDVLASRNKLAELARSGGSNESPQAIAVDHLVGRVVDFQRTSRALPLFSPPEDMGGHSDHAHDDSTWLSPADVIHRVISDDAKLDRPLHLMGLLESMSADRDDPAAFKAHMEAFVGGASALAEARGEYSKVPMEVSFYRADYFTNALVFYLLGFLMLCLSWLMPKARWMGKAIAVPVTLGLILNSAGITMRCILRGRPPVSTLYETIIFIAATGVLACLVMEWINRKRIGVGVGAFVGALGMFLANRYEAHEGVDTMPSLVAVLDTNFWLATHVTTITIGYAAGLFAGAIAHVYLLGKMFGFRKGDTNWYRGIGRMTYGLICFGLLFSVVGTILGGIWANDSWGRFWGWDPKENGALMICLWQLIQLHGRLGGYLRDFGFAISSVFGGMIVAFSWWGVNLLGIGLHSYGFTSGAMYGLLIYYSIESVVMLAAGIHRFATRGNAAAPPPAEATA